MTHGDFAIGGTFRVGESEWRCTDIGTCTIIAIRIDSVSVGGSKPEPHRTLDRAAVEADDSLADRCRRSRRVSSANTTSTVAWSSP